MASLIPPPMPADPACVSTGVLATRQSRYDQILFALAETFGRLTLMEAHTDAIRAQFLARLRIECLEMFERVSETRGTASAEDDSLADIVRWTNQLRNFLMAATPD